MATRQPPVDVGTAPVLQPGLCTPENTPLPGGGSWHWDSDLPGWVENVAHTPIAADVPNIQE